VCAAWAFVAQSQVPLQTPKGIWAIRTALAVMTQDPWETWDLLEQQLEVRRDALGHPKQH